VKSFAERERRQHGRFPQVLEVHARSLPPIRNGYSSPREIHGRIQNLSRGGICIVSSLPLPTAAFVSCEIAMPDTPVSIPTLMQVRWSAKRGNKGQQYINGLRFIPS
jgi:hypothetical protein